MISDAIIRRVKYPPECIPDSWYGTVPVLAEVAPAILDLRRFRPYLAQLADIKLTLNANVVLRARYDDIRIEENTQAFLSYLDGTPLVRALPGAWTLPAKSYLYYNLFGLAPGLINQPTSYSVWAWLPTIAHKLIYAITLTAEEAAISEKLGIANTVEKGLLPLPLAEQMSREYYLLGEETRSRSINIAVGATPYVIENLYPRAGEFIALTRIAAAPGLFNENVLFMVDRDEDSSLATVATFPLSLVAGGEIDCFVPAMKELRLWAQATVAPGAHLFRYTIRRFRLTNLLRVRFGLVSKDEVPGDLYDKVIGGVL